MKDQNTVTANRIYCFIFWRFEQSMYYALTNSCIFSHCLFVCFVLFVVNTWMCCCDFVYLAVQYNILQYSTVFIWRCSTIYYSTAQCFLAVQYNILQYSTVFIWRYSTIYYSTAQCLFGGTVQFKTVYWSALVQNSKYILQLFLYYIILN